MSNDKKRVKKIFANILWMLFDKVFIIILNLLVTVTVANYYGRTIYGSFQYAVSVVAIFEVFVTFIDARVVKKRYITENYGELVWNATISRLMFSAITAMFGVLYLFISKEDGTYKAVFVMLLLNMIILNMRFGMQNRYEYLLKSKKVIIGNNTAIAIGGILQLIAVYLHLSIFSIAVITAFASLISLVIVYVEYAHDYGKLIQGKIRPVLIKGLVIESLPLAIAASCAIIYARCDTLMVGNMLSKDAVGIYGIAAKLIAVVQIALIPIRESVYPDMINLYHADREKYAKRYIQITAIMTWVYIIGVVFSFIVLPYCFRLLKPEYAEAFPVYSVYVIGTFFMYNAGLRAAHYTLINRGDILMFAQAASVVINIILNYILISKMGIYGAAIATGVTQCISLLLSNVFFGETGREVFIWQLKGLNPINIFKRE